VKNLERAIDLKPEDPTINDHLGDASLAHRPHAGSQIPVGACPRPQAGAGGTAEDRSQDRERPAGGHLLRGVRRQEKEDGKGG